MNGSVRRAPAWGVAAAASLLLLGASVPAGAQTFTARPDTAVTVREDTGGCAGPTIVIGEAAGRDGDPTTFARVRVDAQNARCAGGVALAPPEADTAVTWQAFSLPAGAPPVIFISPQDTVRVEIDLVQADADGEPAVLINTLDLPGGDALEDVPALGGEWRLEVLLDRDGDLAFTGEELDLCADGSEDTAPVVPCGIATFTVPADGFGGSVAAPNTVVTLDLTNDIFAAAGQAVVTPDPAADPGVANTGDGFLSGITATPGATIETWTVTVFDVTTPGSELWNVTGSASGLQGGSATTGVAYAVDDGTVSFSITAGGVNFVDLPTPDDFAFNVDSFFNLSEQLWVRVRTQTDPAAGAPAPYISALIDPAPVNTFGSGALTGASASAAAIPQTWTVTVVDDTIPGSEVWDVTGSVSGLQVNQATTTAAYSTDDLTVGFTITAGGTDYTVGPPADDYAFDVENTSTLKISDVRLEILLVFGGTSGGITLSTLPAAILKGRNILSGELLVDADGSLNLPYVWNNGSTDPITGASSLPDGTAGALNATDLDGPDWEILGAPVSNPTGEPGVVGDHWFTVRVRDGASNVNSSSYNLVVDGTDITPRVLPNMEAGQFVSVTFNLVDVDTAAANRGVGVPSYQWLLAVGAQLDGLTFSDGLVEGVPLLGPTSLTLSGTPGGQEQVAFTLGVDDQFVFGAPEQDVAYQDSVSFSGSSTFRILDRSLPPVRQGMRYDDPTANFPYLATVRAIRAPTIPVTDWLVGAPTADPALPPTAGNLEILNETAFANTGFVSIGTLPADPNFPAVSPDDDTLAGTYTFTLEVQDNTGPPTLSAEKEFTIEVLPRSTEILAQPPPITSSTVLSFTVFAEGGVPTAGTMFADEARNGATGEPRYTLQYRVDPEIRVGDDPLDNDDAGKFMGEAANVDPDYVTAWLDWTDFPDNTWPAYTTPGTIIIDLENDVAIADPLAEKASMKPSGGTPRRYRVRFRAVDGLARGGVGVGPAPIPPVQPMAEAGAFIVVVDPGAADTSPEPTQPIRLRQERFN